MWGGCDPACRTYRKNGAGSIRKPLQLCECEGGTESSVSLPRDGSIDVGDDDPVIPPPQIDCAVAATRALILRGHAEDHFVRTLLQLQA